MKPTIERLWEEAQDKFGKYREDHSPDELEKIKRLLSELKFHQKNPHLKQEDIVLEKIRAILDES